MAISLPVLTRTTFALFVFLSPGILYADYDDYVNPSNQKIIDKNNAGYLAISVRTNQYKLPPKIIKSLTLRAILNYNWDIKNASKQQIIAENMSAKLTASFQDNSITLALESNTGSSPNEKWLRSLEKFIKRELTYHFYNQQFDE